MSKLKIITWVLAVVVIVVIAACGETSSGPMGSEGPQGLAGLDGLAGEDGLNGAACNVSCDGRSHTIISCPDSEVRFKVKNCE